MPLNICACDRGLEILLEPATQWGLGVYTSPSAKGGEQQGECGCNACRVELQCTVMQPRRYRVFIQCPCTLYDYLTSYEVRTELPWPRLQQRVTRVYCRLLLRSREYSTRTSTLLVLVLDYSTRSDGQYSYTPAAQSTGDSCSSTVHGPRRSSKRASTDVTAATLVGFHVLLHTRPRICIKDRKILLSS